MSMFSLSIRGSVVQAIKLSKSKRWVEESLKNIGAVVQIKV